MSQEEAPSESLHPPWPDTITSIKSNVIKRVVLGLVLATSFTLIIMMGPTPIIIVIFGVQIVSFSEIINIGYRANKVPEGLPFFRCLCWYFLIAANYFFFGEILANYVQEDPQSSHHWLRNFLRYHRFISFCVYLLGLGTFLVTLVRKHDLKQFKILAWVHTLLIIIVFQTYLAVANIFEGIVWVIIPIAIVVLNDIFAYVFGKNFGKTPLIQLSPNKTWEGFIGGLVGCFISGFILSRIMLNFDFLVCPLNYVEEGGSIRLNPITCTRSYLFVPTEYFGVNVYPFDMHYVFLALFASIIAPFGGFCASGFKRAFKIKNFSAMFPGHGGMVDRFDCHFLMCTFVNVYIFTFVKTQSVDAIFERVSALDLKEQLHFYRILEDTLAKDGLL